MNLNELYSYISFIANKEQSGSTFSPQEYNTNLRAINLDWFRNKYGLPEEYMPGRPIPKEAWEITQKITDDLHKFKVAMGINGVPPMYVNQYGVASIPSDYVHCSSWMYRIITNDGNCSYTKDYSAGEVIRDNQIPDRLSDANKMPTKYNPVCVFYSDFIQFYPEDLGSVNFTYLRFPLTPVYDYYIDANYNTIYLPTGTTHTLLAGEVGSAGQTSGVVTSNTVELEIPEDEHIQYQEAKKQQGA
jgi:hypothetical protein